MATQILYAEEAGKELKFGKLDDTVNLTEFLDEIVGDLFKEKKYFEDEDELTYKVVEYEKIADMAKAISTAEGTILEELKIVRGNEKKAELVAKLKDLALLNDVVIKALLQKCDNSAKVIALL